jgi:hypothetical protein
VLENGIDAAVTWYTYPDPGQAGEQRWIAGVGRIAEDGIHVAEAFETRGAVFGDFDPAAVEYRPWGEFTLTFDTCTAPGQGGLRYRGRSGQHGERRLLQIASHAVVPQHCAAADPAPIAHPGSRYSGSWYRGPEAPGEGLQFLVDAAGHATLVWYTFDPEGNSAWLLGPPAAALADGRWRFQMLRPRGTRFGADFNPAQVDAASWGEVELHFPGCDRAELRWMPSEAGWSPGSTALVRLTRPAASADCALEARKLGPAAP